MNTIRTPRHLLIPSLCLLLAACSGGASRDTDYGDIATGPALEVPPGMSAPDTRGAMELPKWEGGAKPVLPQVDGVRIERDGAQRWLVVDESVDALWPRLRAFWATAGLSLERDEEQLGIMETAWAENKRDLPDTWLRSIMPGLYAAPYRDKYRLRLERGESGGAEIYLSHYQIEEVAKGESFQWQSHPADAERLREIERRLMLHLGVPRVEVDRMLATADAAAAEAPRARVEKGPEGLRLSLDERFDRAWRHTRTALDGIGLVVDDHDRTQGLFYVSVIGDPSKGGGNGGWFDWFGGGDENARVKRRVQLLRADEKSTFIYLFDDQDRPMEEGQTRPLLELLAKQLNG